MKKISTAGILAFSIIASFSLINDENSVNATNQNKEVYQEGHKIKIDQKPILIDAITYAPETTSSSVLWGNQNQKAIIEDAFKKFTYKVGDSKGNSNSIEFEMPNSFIGKEKNSSQIMNKSVSIDKNETENIDKKIKKVVNELEENAVKYIGTPYLYGASPKIITYFDGSSFAQRLFAESGIYLPRVTAAQYKYGEDVSISQIKAGDLLFFDTIGKGEITHVAIYINENKLLHANTSTGVDYTTFNSYWATRYLSAARVIH